MIIYRELTGGIYFGEKKLSEDETVASDLCEYSQFEIERIAHLAFKAAQNRSKKVTLVDKANVLAVMRLWRRTIIEVHEDYSDVALEHLLVDAATMHLLTRPASFDVIVAGNMFGDILSDEASMLTGSIGMLPSASLDAKGKGLYEPIHGSAPDIAGQGVANPLATILSAAMMLRYSLGRSGEAERVEAAVTSALREGIRTADIYTAGTRLVGTNEMGRAVLEKL